MIGHEVIWAVQLGLFENFLSFLSSDQGSCIRAQIHESESIWALLFEMQQNFRAVWCQLQELWAFNIFNDLEPGVAITVGIEGDHSKRLAFVDIP